ncbi:hypothetical protein QBC43DRAFT_330985 [Cladorrhinum sp. PSN259]|nr:hypothetical protein QBC43DRAFT_330985 [Cladorrhinum sp. PSN259]
MKRFDLAAVMVGVLIRVSTAQSCNEAGDLQNTTNPQAPSVPNCVKLFKQIQSIIDPAELDGLSPNRTLLGTVTMDSELYRIAHNDCTFDVRVSSGKVDIDAMQVLDLFQQSIDDHTVIFEGQAKVETSGDLVCPEGTARWWIYNL